MNIILNGAITPDSGSPLACAPMRPDREVNLRDKYPQGGGDTARLPRLAVTDGGEKIYTAYFPASGVRGKLRRLARDALYNITGKNGWDIETHRVLTIGGVKGSGAEGSIDIEGIRALRERYPLQSVFGQSQGFGMSWVGGKLMVGFAVPDRPLIPDVVTGVRSDDLVRDPDEASFLNEAAYKKLSEIANNERRATALRQSQKALKEKKLPAAKREGDEQLTERLTAELADVEAKLKEAPTQSDVSVQMPLSGYEVIPPGTSLHQRMILRNATDAEAGVLFHALELFAMDPCLGAHAAQGCGIVQCEWRVSLDVGDGGYKGIGAIKLTPFTPLELQGEELQSLVGAWKAAFEKIAKNTPVFGERQVK